MSDEFVVDVDVPERVISATKERWIGKRFEIYDTEIMPVEKSRQARAVYFFQRQLGNNMAEVDTVKGRPHTNMMRASQLEYPYLFTLAGLSVKNIGGYTPPMTTLKLFHMGCEPIFSAALSDIGNEAMARAREFSKAFIEKSKQCVLLHASQMPQPHWLNLFEPWSDIRSIVAGEAFNARLDIGESGEG